MHYNARCMMENRLGLKYNRIIMLTPCIIPCETLVNRTLVDGSFSFWEDRNPGSAATILGVPPVIINSIINATSL